MLFRVFRRLVVQYVVIVHPTQYTVGDTTILGTGNNGNSSSSRSEPESVAVVVAHP